MKLIEKGYNCDRISRSEKLVIANGSFGYRGTLEEHTYHNNVALIANGLYDQNGDKWREPVNFPNPLYIMPIINGTRLDDSNVTYHKEWLELENATFNRLTKFNINNVTGVIKSQRFFDPTRCDLLISRWVIKTIENVDLEIYSGIDTIVWNINGDHFKVNNYTFNPLNVTAITNEGKKINIEVIEECNHSISKNLEIDGKIVNCYNINTNEVIITKYIFLSHSYLSSTNKPILDYDSLLNINNKYYLDKWKKCKINIIDDDDLQLAIDYSIYQLLINAPKVDGISMPARGVTSQTYKGAIFWDTEMFMVPFFLETDKEVAKRLVRYRINTLNGAIEKAKYYGYDGAFYAWESQENGIDGCTDFNVIDVFTHRKVRTYFKDKQVHISADVAVCLYKTYLKTKDISLLLDGGIKVLLECAKFYYSYSYYNHNKERFEILSVMGPDEYHECVNNNAYTNYMAYQTVKYALDSLKVIKNKNINYYNEIMNEYSPYIQKLKKYRRLLYLPKPNEDKIIEQFDGYFNLEDVNVDEVRSRLVKENEYWGGTTGVATPTRVIKQADVIALMCVLDDLFTEEEKLANYKYYLPYTEHGSSLSISMYSQCACSIGFEDDSYEWLKKNATLDLIGGGKKYAGEIYIGGTHLAACGGTWQIIFNGYLKKGRRLPKQIKSLKIKTIRGEIDL